MGLPPRNRASPGSSRDRALAVSRDAAGTSVPGREPLGGAEHAARPPASWPTASTRAAGVIGWPVRHSLSPILHNAALASMGLDWAYLAFEVPPASFEAAMHGAVALGLEGLSVTMPHKEAAARLASRRSAVARKLGSANTLIFGARGVLAESTDGEGLLDDLRLNAGFDPEGRRCGIVGAGGAARAAVLALAEAGASEVIVVNRTIASAWKAAALAPGVARVARPDELSNMDLVVQATPAGMGGAASGTPSPLARVPWSPAAVSPSGTAADQAAMIAGVDPALLGAGQLVVDLVYEPPVTPFLDAARRNGARVRNGLGMLVHQAAHQLTLWTDAAAPLDAMWAAARAARGADAPAPGRERAPGVGG